MTTNLAENFTCHWPEDTIVAMEVLPEWRLQKISCNKKICKEAPFLHEFIAQFWFQGEVKTSKKPKAISHQGIRSTVLISSRGGIFQKAIRNSFSSFLQLSKEAVQSCETVSLIHKAKQCRVSKVLRAPVTEVGTCQSREIILKVINISPSVHTVHMLIYLSVHT